MPSAISIDRLSFRYAGSTTWALSDISLSVEQGECIAIMGASGAGKTTLCLAMNGVVPNLCPGEIKGQVSIYGVVAGTRPVREMSQMIELVLDNPEYQFIQPSVREELALGLEQADLPPEEIDRRIVEILSMMGLEGMEERSPFALSGGQQQRLAIANALALMPNVLVMDEPSSQLDPLGKAALFALINALSRQRGLTVVMTTHESELAAQYCDRIIVLRAGRVVLQGSPARVFSEVDTLDQTGVRVPPVTEAWHRAVGVNEPSFGTYPVTVPQAAALLNGKGR